ncbi:cytoskeleton-associated protein 2-like isoform X2 [Antennarius striatus]
MHRARTALSVNNKVNVKSNIQTGRQKNNSQSETSGGAQPGHNDNFTLMKRCITVSSKPNLNTVSHFKKQSKPGIKASGRPSSNTAMTTSTIRFSSSSNAVSDRISLGPLIKTKTGLIPAVIQPRRIQSQTQKNRSTTTVGITTITSSFVANKVRPTSSTISLCKGFAMAQRKTLHITAPNNPVKKGSIGHLTTTARLKVEAESNSKPLLSKVSQVSCKRQLSSGVRTTSKSNCTASSSKPEGRVGMSKTNKSIGLNKDKCTTQKSELEGEKNGQQCRFTLRTSFGPVSRCSSRAASGATRAVVVESARQSRKCTETYSDSGRVHRSANAPSHPSAPVLSQTAPQPSRTISCTDVKTIKIPIGIVPQTEGKKLSAAQEERMRKLKEWREAKGISYKRPPMPVKPLVRRTVATCQPFWTTMREEDEANSLICAVDRSLADCIKLLGEGCDLEQVKAILSRLPVVSQKFVKYWICRARLMEQEGNLDVLPLFEEAVSIVLEPVDKLRTVVFEILKKKDEIQEFEKKEAEEEEEGQISPAESTPDSMNNSMRTHEPVRALLCGEKGVSSVIKYKITATPGGPPSQQSEPARVYGQEVRFFTPVRRSVRIERASLRYPASLQDHDVCVSSYNDLMSMEDEERKEEQEGRESDSGVDGSPSYLYVYRQNEALKDKVHMQLISNEALQL